MINFIAYFKCFLYSVILLLITTFLINLLYYNDFIISNSINYFKMITAIICSLIGGISLGKNVPNKAYLHGLIYSLIAIFLMIIISLIVNKFSYKNFFYYIPISLAIILGSTIGINKKKVS